ncbi:hypothetical protein [Microbacterium sp. EST19A]|uniref:hypothetical protein n=1 Tax=Microbacterium sp. EST19A TaxID=2862681 RepID=UPI001CC0AAB8|nr:hypothetical protein [Microbacterium sp. EST19A]
MSDAELRARDLVIVAMDYGQFTLAGGFEADDLALLAAAQQHPPSASDGRSVLVLSPHQNNFAMKVVVELWSDRPPRDETAWDQVSVEPLAVGPTGALRLASPTLDDTLCPTPPDEYRVEISGRGFVNYGWPGSTEPGDEWRLRLWPSSSGSPGDVRRLWNMPGYGTPWSPIPGSVA